MLSVKLKGRLGNQLFQYAVCRTIAEKNGYKYSISSDFLGRDLFNCDLGVEKHNCTKVYDEDTRTFRQAFDINLLNIEDNTLLNGYFQTEKYFDYNEENIKEWFKVEKDKYNYSLVEECLLKYNPEEYICINFRGGDYTKPKYISLIPHQSYYIDSIDYFLNINDKYKFIIVTDDILYSKMYFDKVKDKIEDIIHIDINSDFMLVKSYKNRIISASSFSWWAAWLNSEITIAPEGWFNSHSKQPCSPTDIISKKFIIL